MQQPTNERGGKSGSKRVLIVKFDAPWKREVTRNVATIDARPTHRHPSPRTSPSLSALR